jgi:hypothetical protein
MSEWQSYAMIGVLTAAFLGVWIWALVRSKPGRAR